MTPASRSSSRRSTSSSDAGHRLDHAAAPPTRPATPRSATATGPAGICRSSPRVLSRRVGRLTVRVPSELARATVRVGDRALPSAAWGVPVPVDPGEVVVRVSDAARRHEQTVTVRVAAAAALVSMPLPRAEVAVAPTGGVAGGAEGCADATHRGSDGARSGRWTVGRARRGGLRGSRCAVGPALWCHERARWGLRWGRVRSVVGRCGLTDARAHHGDQRGPRRRERGGGGGRGVVPGVEEGGGREAERGGRRCGRFRRGRGSRWAGCCERGAAVRMGGRRRGAARGVLR